MSKPASTKLSSLSSVVIRIITNHVRAIEALATTSTNSLDYTMLLSSYENAISLTYTLHSSENLTDQFAALATENEDLAPKRDTTIADHNTLTTWVTQLEAQLM
jgi:membrane-bound lytic murein transglycosylase MltF